MNVLILGATGMIGQGALRECLLDDGVHRVVTLGRTPTGQRHPKLTDIAHGDLLDLAPIESDLAGLDACFFCVGITSVGLDETRYARVTQDIALSVAETVSRSIQA